ncbi:MAG TPA: hypothetical protein VFW40_06880, partial [Capsulimonadaceae bacterium]|nr:hypothetical protein [Capsulimonadaceae bacterium]
QEKGNPSQRLFGVREVSAYDDGAETPILKLGFSGKGQVALKLDGAVSLASFTDGAPAITEFRHGKGGAVLIASDAGVVDSNNGQAGLSNFLSAILRKDAGVSPTITASTDGYVDTSVLRDASGNQLFVVTNAVNGLDTPPVHANVDIAVRHLSLAPGSQLFILDPEATINGQTTAGPRLVSVVEAKGHAAHVKLHNFDSAEELLVAANHDPLLRLASPSAAAPGSSVTIKVICYNPSPRSIAGALTLVTPSGWKFIGAAHSVKIGPRGETDVTLKAVANSDPGRSVVKAKLTWPGGSVLSVPVDIFASAPVKP